MLLMSLWLVASLSGQSITASVDDTEPVVTLEIRISDQPVEFSSLTGRTIRAEQGQTANLRLSVFADANLTTPMDVDDPVNLLEMSQADGGAPLRISDWLRVDVGVYETTYELLDAGELRLGVLPDQPDGHQQSGASGGELLLIVGGSDQLPVGPGPQPIGLLVALLMLVTVGTLVVLGTRSKRRSPAKPLPHDTWWNSP